MAMTAKKRKLTDKSISPSLLRDPEFASESRMYQDLLEMERKLDWTMTRKKLEVQDTLSRNPSTTRTLRLFVSHTVSGQAWQTGESGVETVNVETGQGVPAWALKIEGRLLELPNVRKDKQPMRQFSRFIKRLIVELERDPLLYPEGNIVEWPRVGEPPPALHGFTIQRKGDTLTRVRIIMYMNHFPEQYRVKNELAQVLGIQEDSRTGVIQALWNYIRIHGLQDKVDRRQIRADEHLRPVFGGADSVNFYNLPELVNRFLAPPDPVVIQYTINPAAPPPEKPQAWDIEVKVEDSVLKGKMSAMLQVSKDTQAELFKLDEEIARNAQSLHNAHLKRTFMETFAQDPVDFIQKWVESQSRDLETVLGSGPSEGATVRAEDLRRSDFFRLPWVEEAVAVQEGMRMASKGMQ